MDQSKLEQRLERLMVMRDKAEAMLDASRDIIQEVLRAQIVKLDAWIEKIKAERKANHQKMDSSFGKTKASPETTEAFPEVTPACLKKEKEPAPEVPNAVAETEEVPVGATGEEAIGAAKDRSENLRLAVRCCRRLKTRTKRDGRLRQIVPPPSEGRPVVSSPRCAREDFRRDRVGCAAAVV
jgi:hypothetical protein